MNIITRFPILLTLVERDYLNHHFADERSSADVYKALYLQGEQLDQDRVVHWRPLAARPDRDERGVGWKDADSCWITQDQETFQVTRGQEPVPVQLPPGLASASGRFVWTIERSAEEGTCLRQRDLLGKQNCILWQHAGWAGVSLASDPSRDRLAWSHNAGGSLQTWDPEQASNQPMTSAFEKDFSQLAFSPDGKSLAFVHDQQVYCLNGDDTHPISGPRSDNYNYTLQPSWSPNGKRIFYVSAHFDISNDMMLESYQWVAATPTGSQRRVLLAGAAVAALQVGPVLL